MSTDGGETWGDASLDPVDPAAGRWAWRKWSFEWAAATEGPTELLCRATDQLGQVQPVEQPWNRQGMANNMVQRIPVLVRGR